MVSDVFNTICPEIHLRCFQTCNVQNFLGRSWLTIECSGSTKLIKNDEENEEFFCKIGCFKSSERHNVFSCVAHYDSMTTQFKHNYVHKPTCFGKGHVGGRRIQISKGRSTTYLPKSKEILYYVEHLLPPGSFLCTPCNFYYGQKLKEKKSQAMEVDESGSDGEDLSIRHDQDYDPNETHNDSGLGNERKKSKMETDPTDQEDNTAMGLVRKLTNLNGFQVS